MLIPVINNSIKNNSDLNSTLVLKYAFSPEKTLDLYCSNAAGVQDIGQRLEDNEYRFGIKLIFYIHKNLKFIFPKRDQYTKRLLTHFYHYF